MIDGSCLCGSVSWRIDGTPSRMTHCHCSMCRKAHAAPFATYVETELGDFRWLSGESAVVAYESSPGHIRSFCGTCGSTLPETFRTERIMVPAGCLNGDPGVRPSSHIFVASKAPWHDITDDLPQFDTYPDPDDAPNVERPVHTQSQDGLLRGSCLCGDVAYEVSTPIRAVHNCHCSRCRKARAAAHTTNGFTAADGVRFVRGESRLRDFKVLSAKSFRQVFCARCGSGMPRLNPERGIANVPFGSLDDDPHRGADDHIFTGSKAPWFVITGPLPRFEERAG